MTKKIKLAPKNYADIDPEALRKAVIEAEVVDAFVEGRKMTNEGNRKQTVAKKFFINAKKKSFVGSMAQVFINDGEQMGFDKDAFIRDFGMEIYNKYYKPTPCIKYAIKTL